MFISIAVAPTIATGPAAAPTDSTVDIPVATGAAVTTVVVPVMTDDISVPPIAELILLSALNVASFAAGKAVHSAQVFNDERLFARLYRLKN
jgi:hypothetical protein